MVFKILILLSAVGALGATVGLILQGMFNTEWASKIVEFGLLIFVASWAVILVIMSLTCVLCG